MLNLMRAAIFIGAAACLGQGVSATARPMKEHIVLRRKSKVLKACRCQQRVHGDRLLLTAPGSSYDIEARTEASNATPFAQCLRKGLKSIEPLNVSAQLLAFDISDKCLGQSEEPFDAAGEATSTLPRSMPLRRDLKCFGSRFVNMETGVK